MKNKMIFIPVIVIALLLIVFVVYKSNQLKNIHITSSITIEAPVETVFDKIVHLKYFDKWSPYLSKDPGLKTEIKGDDGTVGTQFHWDGNDGKEKGYQEIAKIEPQQSVIMNCFIEKPFEGSSTFSYQLEEKNGKTIVKQDFDMTASFVPAFFMWISGTKTEMENLNQLGLENLKKVIDEKK